MALAAIPPLLSSPFILRATIVLVPSYLLSSTLPANSSPPSSSTSCSSRRIVQLPTVCRSESCANNLTKLVDLLDASYLLSCTLPASSSISYSSRLTCYHPRRRHPHRHPHRHHTRCVLLAIIHAASILIDIVLVASYVLSSMPPASSSTSYSSRLTCYHPRRRHPHRHPHRHRTRCVLLAIIYAAGILTAILIDIVLVASYLLSSTPPASSPPSSLTSYLSCRIVQLPTVCRSESCTNNLTKLVDLLAASYFLSSTPPASSWTSYLSHLTCYLSCHWHPHRHRTRRVLLAIFHATGIRIDIVLVASYSLLSLQLASEFVSTSLMSFSLHCVSSSKLPLLLSRRAMPST